MSKLFYGDIGHEPSLDPPIIDADVFEVKCHCDICGEAIYVGDAYYDLGGATICESCVDDGRKTA